MTKTQEAYNFIYETLEPYLNKVGEIDLPFAHHVCGLPYNIVAKSFKLIMDTMVEQKKAKRVKAGCYRIMIPNQKTR